MLLVEMYIASGGHKFILFFFIFYNFTLCCFCYILYFNCHIQVMHLDAEKEMMSQSVALLGKFIAVREPNIRYLGLVSCGHGHC